MSSRDIELTPFSYAVLALVGKGGAGPHDWCRMMRRGRIYWAAAESHYYSEPKRLERLGYLTSRKAPGRTRERTHYRAHRARPRSTASLGRGAVHAPPHPARGGRQAAGQRLTGDERVVLESLQAMRDRHRRCERSTRRAEAVARRCPTGSAISASSTDSVVHCSRLISTGSKRWSESSAAHPSRIAFREWSTRSSSAPGRTGSPPRSRSRERAGPCSSSKPPAPSAGARAPPS